MPTVFLTLVCRSTLSNRPTRVLNAPWSQRGIPHSRGSPTPLCLCHTPMLSHHVTCHISHCHLLLALPAVKPSLQALPLGRSLPHNPSTIRRLRLIPRRLAGSEYHADCLPDVGPQVHPIKQAIQGAFNTLVGLFNRVVLQTNLGKTVGMVCHPFQAAGNQLEAAYGRRIMG